MMRNNTSQRQGLSRQPKLDTPGLLSHLSPFSLPVSDIEFNELKTQLQQVEFQSEQPTLTEQAPLARRILSRGDSWYNTLCRLNSAQLNSLLAHFNDQPRRLANLECLLRSINENLLNSLFFPLIYQLMVKEQGEDELSKIGHSFRDRLEEKLSRLPKKRRVPPQFKAKVFVQNAGSINEEQTIYFLMARFPSVLKLFHRNKSVRSDVRFANRIVRMTMACRGEVLPKTLLLPKKAPLTSAQILELLSALAVIDKLNVDGPLTQDVAHHIFARLNKNCQRKGFYESEVWEELHEIYRCFVNRDAAPINLLDYFKTMLLSNLSGRAFEFFATSSAKYLEQKALVFPGENRPTWEKIVAIKEKYETNKADRSASAPLATALTLEQFQQGLVENIASALPVKLHYPFLKFNSLFLKIDSPNAVEVKKMLLDYRDILFAKIKDIQQPEKMWINLRAVLLEIPMFNGMPLLYVLMRDSIENWPLRSAALLKDGCSLEGTVLGEVIYWILKDLDGYQVLKPEQQARLETWYGEIRPNQSTLASPATLSPLSAGRNQERRRWLKDKAHRQMVLLTAQNKAFLQECNRLKSQGMSLPFFHSDVSFGNPNSVDFIQALAGMAGLLLSKLTSLGRSMTYEDRKERLSDLRDGWADDQTSFGIGRAIFQTIRRELRHQLTPDSSAAKEQAFWQFYRLFLNKPFKKRLEVSEQELKKQFLRATNQDDIILLLPCLLAALCAEQFGQCPLRHSELDLFLAPLVYNMDWLENGPKRKFSHLSYHGYAPDNPDSKRSQEVKKLVEQFNLARKEQAHLPGSVNPPPAIFSNLNLLQERSNERLEADEQEQKFAVSARVLWAEKKFEEKKQPTPVPLTDKAPSRIKVQKPSPVKVSSLAASEQKQGLKRAPSWRHQPTSPDPFAPTLTASPTRRGAMELSAWGKHERKLGSDPYGLSLASPTRAPQASRVGTPKSTRSPARRAMASPISQNRSTLFAAASTSPEQKASSSHSFASPSARASKPFPPARVGGGSSHSNASPWADDSVTPSPKAGERKESELQSMSSQASKTVTFANVRLIERTAPTGYQPATQGESRRHPGR